MKHYFSTLPVLALSMMSVFAPNVKADDWDKKTNITINQAIEVEGTVLPAGSYVLKLVNPSSERYLVRILNAEENRVVATVFTTPAYRPSPPDNSEFKFYESGAGQAPALRSWFYPGDSTGFEFKEHHGAPAAVVSQSANTMVSNASSN